MLWPSTTGGKTGISGNNLEKSMEPVGINSRVYHRQYYKNELQLVDEATQLSNNT